MEYVHRYERGVAISPSQVYLRKWLAGVDFDRPSGGVCIQSPGELVRLRTRPNQSQDGNSWDPWLYRISSRGVLPIFGHEEIKTQVDSRDGDP